MKTEAQIEEFYHDVIHPTHDVSVRMYRTVFSGPRLYDVFGGINVCKFEGDEWWIRHRGLWWHTFTEYINTFRTDLPDSDKLALILKYS